MDDYSALIIDDHDSVRNMLGRILLKLIPNIQINEASTLAQAKQLIPDKNYQLAIVDISLPDGDGITLLPAIRQQNPGIYIVMCTIYNDDNHLFEALKAGASGYLVKGQTEEQLTNKFRGMLEGEPPLSSSVARRMLQHFHSPTEDKIECLTDREIEVLQKIAMGKTRREVSEEFSISEHTVADHIKRIYKKLGITSRSEATVEALRRGLIQY